MVFAPVAPEIKERIIELHLAGFGRNKIDRQLKIESVKISHGSISNVINMYKRKHEQSLQSASSCNEVIAQPDASISIGVGLKETSPPSLKPQDAHGVGLAFIPINPNSSAKPKPRNGSPLSHILIEDTSKSAQNQNQKPRSQH
jgi:hypothetical protein